MTVNGVCNAKRMKSKSTKVIAPRNVDLPPHVLRGDKHRGRHFRKRCLCLTCWLFGLLLLCVGVVAVINFVLPDVLLSEKLRVDPSCPVEDGSSLDYRVSSSEVILVADGSSSGALLPDRILKGSYADDPTRTVPCIQRDKRVYFLESTVPKDEKITFKFPSLPATRKLVSVIGKLLDSEDGDPNCDDSSCQFGARCVPGKAGSFCDCKGIDCSSSSPKPVCGSDHITYKNECDLLRVGCSRRINLTVISHEPCEESRLCGPDGCPFGGSCVRTGGFYRCVCAQICDDGVDDKICGNNNKIYKSECHMELDSCESKLTNLTAAAYDSCYSCNETCKWNQDCLYSSDHGKSECSCPECLSSENGDPVCGTDNVTYDSVCSLRRLNCLLGKEVGRAQDVRVKYPGECRTTKYDKPIPCGRSSCDFGALCEENSYCVCSVKCHEYYGGAVCGNDGRTYETECQLRRYACKMQKEISVVDFKPCTRGATRIGDYCTEECLISESSCIENRCVCLVGTRPNRNNTACETPMGSLCDPNPCRGGGTCDEHDGTFSCYCRPGLTGPRCEHDLSLTDVNIASFTGQDSHAEIRIPTDSVKRLEIEILFRTFNLQEGLLLYGRSQRENDFISLAIMDGYIIFSYDLGGGAVTLKSHGRVEKGAWTHLVAKRYHQDGLLELERTDKVIGSTKGSLRTLNIDGHLWIGGVDLDDYPLMYKARQNAGTSIGFVGCIKELKINKKTITLQSMREPLVIHRRKIVDCAENACRNDPCHNDGLCISQSDDFLCHCKKDFKGRSCQRRRNDQCDPNPCQNDGICHIKDRGFVCVCSGSEYYGTYCDLKTVQTLSDQPFQSPEKLPIQTTNNTLSFDLKKSLGLTDETLLEMKVSFTDESSGRMRLSSTKTGLLKITLNNEEGLHTNWITSPPFFISDNRWHRILLDVRPQEGKMNVNLDGLTALRSVNLEESFHVLSFKGVSKRRNECLKNLSLVLSSAGGNLKSLKSQDTC